MCGVRSHPASDQPGSGPMARRDGRDNSTMVRGISRDVCDSSTGDAMELRRTDGSGILSGSDGGRGTLLAAAQEGTTCDARSLVQLERGCASSIARTGGSTVRLSELGTLHWRSLWLTVNNSGWVDRHVFRQWFKWFRGWVAEMRRQWRLDPAEPAILLLDNASSEAAGDAVAACEPYARGDYASPSVPGTVWSKYCN
jgi:hypothetical protein